MRVRWEVMTKNIIIRKIPEKTSIQLHMMAKKQGYSSFNAFMLDQFTQIIAMDGLNLYENQFAETLTKVKEQQAEILELLLKNEISETASSAKQDILDEMTKEWLNRFMSK